MAFRLSLRNKLVYTFLGGSLLTVLLFSAVLKEIMNDYFQRLAEVRLQFVTDQGRREIANNVAIFRNAFQNIFDDMGTSVGTLAQSGVIGDHLPRSRDERQRMADMLLLVQQQAKISMITVVDLKGRVIIRGNDPDTYGDDTLMRDYDDAPKPVSSIRRLILNALAGQTIKSFEIFPPEILAKSKLADTARIQLKKWTVEVPPNTFEERGLVMTVVMPLRTSSGNLAGAIVAGRLLNKDLSIVTNIQKLLGDSASIFLGDVRVATTATIGTGPRETRENATGSLLNPDQDRVLNRGELLHIRDDRQFGQYEPLKNDEKQVIGALWIGRPLTFISSVDKQQTAIEQTTESLTNIYILLGALISMLAAIVIASFLSKLVTARIDQLRKGAAIIEKGRLDHRLRIDSGDEIEQLSRQFNSMASKLEESHQTLERKVEERTLELRESQEAMVQQEKMVGVGQLAAGIAHELNTPLGTIIGYAQMLREDLSQQAAPTGNLRDVDEIIGQAGRCRDLVKNLLNFSRRSSTEKTNGSVNEIIRKVLSLVQHDFEMKNVRLHLNLDSDAPTVRVNENEIAQVILNLANNAADSMPSGGNLDVSTHYEDDSDRICITIRDTGSGIKESDRTRVFEPFFTTKEVGKGTGLGLSISYKIVENHQGSIEFDTALGNGTTFRVYLPAKAQTEVGVV
jgi:two-component system, NtrC family, sensor kinase